MNPDPPLPSGKRYPYIQWGDCSKCGTRFPMSLNMVRKAQGLVGKPERPTCQKCRLVVKKRRSKRVGKPECLFAGKISAGTLAKMHLRQAPESGTPSWCPFKKRFYVRYFLGRGRAVADEERAYLDATTEPEAIEEARDWYTRALLHGAKWLPEEFAAEGVDNDHQRTLATLRKIRRKGRRIRPPRKVRIRRRKIRAWVLVDRFTVTYNGKTVRSDLKTRAAAEQLAVETRERYRIQAQEPGLLKCVKCGVKPIWDGKTLVHEGDDYCANMVMIRDRRIGRQARIALWNLVLRHGDYGGWWDFRFEHIMLSNKIREVIPDRKPYTRKTEDPLEGFEI